MDLPEQTLYEIESLRRIMDGEGFYSTMEEREAVIDRLRYSISEDIISRILSNTKKSVS